MLDTDGTMEDVATKLVVVMEDGAEDIISAENAASVLLLVCLDAIGESTKNGRQHKPPRRALKTKHTQTASQMHDLELEIARPPRASTRHMKLDENPYVE